MYLLCCRGILYQLNQAIAMDHLPGRERQVAPRSKNLRVNHAQASGADIGHEVAGAGRDAGSAGLNRLLKGSGVRHEHQARAAPDQVGS